MTADNVASEQVTRAGDALERPNQQEFSAAERVIAGGEMGARVRTHDWATSALGPMTQWAPSWHTVMNLCLSSDFPMTITWGPEFTQVYNDAYIPVLGAKHPQALQQTFAACWAEVWDVLGPMAVQAMTTGVPSYRENMRMLINRYGFVEEAFFTYSFSPIRDETGRIAGLFHPAKEVTREVLAERRVRALRDLAARAGESDTAEGACAVAAETLGKHSYDLSFVLVYLVDAENQRARLAGMAGLEASESARPGIVELVNTDLPHAWPLGQVALGNEAMLVADVEARFGALTGGPWPESTREALVLPIPQPGSDMPAGLLVAGVSPRRPLDDSYRGFFDLVTGQLATAIANARAYEAEKRRSEALAELDRAKTQFFSNVSHEFRTPLTLMLGPTEAALRDGVPGGLRPALAGDDLVMVHRNALRLLKLVNSMLDFSRIEAGRLQATYEPTDLAAYTADLASNFRSAMDRAGIQLQVDAAALPAHLPPVYVDRDLWEKIVLNLLSNAFKHTFEGEVTVRVLTRDGRAVVEVADTGVGIPPDQLDHVFVRFHRVPNARSRTHEGTGIGLALVRELVKLHAGTIHVSSTLGRGTTFTVTLPFGAAHLAPDRIGPHAAAGGIVKTDGVGASAYVAEALRWLPDQPVDRDEDRGALDGNAGALPFPPITSARPGTRIIVADDNADMREYVTRLLRERGWQVESVADGAAALAAARAHAPDLVLSDVMMPGLDGFALLDALRRDPSTSSIPVVLLSARAGEEARLEGVTAGAADYLVKPFSARELVARVAMHLERARDAIDEQRLAKEQERLLAAVQAERAKLEGIFAQAPVAICVLRGPNHVFELANSFYRRIVPNATIGQPLADSLPEAESQGYVALLSKVLQTGEPWIGRGVELHYDRHGRGQPERAFFNALYYPLLDEDATRVGVVAVIVEVTTEVEAQREADAARAEAEYANRAKGEFLAAMSHELRTPLNAIGGHTQLVELGVHGPVTPAQVGALQRVQRSQERLLSLINDVLNFAKLEAGHVDFHLEDVSLTDALANVVPLLEPQFTAKEIACEVDALTDVRVCADREKVEQILLNLLSNSVKFTPPGGCVRVRCESDARGARVLVHDTGVGIAPEFRERVFEPFVQVDTRLTRTQQGTGLGLSISRDLARQMGGDLTVESEVGRGSTFVLMLPVPANGSTSESGVEATC